MTYHTMADTAAASFGAVYFVGPGATFSRVALRTVETELDGPTQRVSDLEALRFARMDQAGVVRPAYMVVVHESCARALLAALEEGAQYLPPSRIAIAFEDEATARAHFVDICDRLLARRVSLLPMNTNVTNWVRLLQVIQSGGQYVPPELLKAPAEPAASGGGGTPEAVARAARALQPPAPTPRPAEAGRTPPRLAAPARTGLTPREAEVLEMAAAGQPNKTIAGALDLSEHTVKLYMHRIIGKLGVRNRTEAAVWFHQRSGHA